MTSSLGPPIYYFRVIILAICHNSVKTKEICSVHMSSKLSLEPEIEFFIDQNNAMSSHFLIENVQSNMIVKLECFSGHCHIAPIWMILYTQF